MPGIFERPCFLIDSKYLCYRSVYGLFNLSLQDVERNMFYGFVKTLFSILKGVKLENKKILKPFMLALCWDSRHSYRKMAYPNYKARRPVPENQLKVIEQIDQSIPKLRSWMERIGFINAIYPGYEADDIFAGYIGKYPEFNFVVTTNDEDIYQLLSSRVVVYMLRKKSFVMTRENFIAEYKIDPSKWACIKAIGGCKSDNIPGVPGIGEKKAIKYILSEGKGECCEVIKEYKSDIAFFYTLTKLPYLHGNFPNLTIDKINFNYEEFTKFCQIYNFRSFVMQLGELREHIQAISF